MKQTLIIGTRASKLALWQSNYVADLLKQVHPNLDVSMRTYTTQGDRILSKSLAELGGKDLFTKELDQALLAGDVDLCVHSMKDVARVLPQGLGILAMPKRADARDVLVCGPRLAHCRSLASIPAGARLGTGSLRRSAQLRAAFPLVQPLDMRGNVDTRIEKAYSDRYDGAILAAAGLERIGLGAHISAYLSVQEMVPAAGQGAIGIEARVDDDRVRTLLAAINDAETMRCVQLERRILAALGGDCKTPIGVYAHFSCDDQRERVCEDQQECAREEQQERVCDEQTAPAPAPLGDKQLTPAPLHNANVQVDAVVLSLDGARIARASFMGAYANAEKSIIDQLASQGAFDILADVVRASATGGACE